jgi:PRTRC genetic system protein C
MTEGIKKIRYGDKEFQLDPGMTLEQAKDLMARHFPELADPQVETKSEKGVTVYVLTKRAGRKGAGLVDQLLTINETPILPDEAQPISRAILGDENEVNNMPNLHHLANQLTEDSHKVQGLASALTNLPPAGQLLGGVLL